MVDVMQPVSAANNFVSHPCRFSLPNLQGRCISLLAIATSSRPQHAPHDGMEDAADDVDMAVADAAAGTSGTQMQVSEGVLPHLSRSRLDALDYTL